MVRVSCRCLNVSVYIKGTDSPYQKGQSTTLGSLLGSEYEKAGSALSSLQLWEADLDVAGVAVRLSPLLVTQAVSDWWVHHCYGCDSSTHVTHKVNGSRVLIGSGMEYRSEELSSLERSRDYSPIFKVVLRDGQGEEEEDEEPTCRKRVSSLSYGRDDPAMKTIHRDMKAFLQEEQEAMEARVKAYEEEQRRRFSELQSRAHRDRTTIFRLMSRARENALSEAIQDVPSTGVSPPVTSVTMTTQSPPDVLKGSGGGVKRNSKVITLEENKSSADEHVAPLVGRQRRSPDNEADVFDGMEGFEADNERDYTPFSQSDDDSLLTDDSFRDEGLGEEGVVKGVAHSMPVSVPLFRRSPKKSSADNDDERTQITVEKMAASIQALALSCHDTGMFGELPKPRLNSIPWRQ